jgi:hypothetical protein
MSRPNAGALRRAPRPFPTRLAATAAVVFVVVACGSATGSPSAAATSIPPATATVIPAGSAASTAPSSAASTGVVATTGSATSASPAITVTIDPGLAHLLPSTVLGVPVVEATTTEDAARSSARFADAASGFAAVEAIKSGDSDLAIVSIVRLRPDASPSTFYGEWRPSYDDAACKPAGGVSTRETQQIGGRSVDVTHCVQGATLYHVWLGGENVLVSVLDVGPSRLGRAIVEGASDPAP